MRTVANLPDGLALDLVRQMECKPGNETVVPGDFVTLAVAGAVVRYDETRTLRGIEYLKTTLDKRCEMVARYLSLISATLPPAEMIPEKKEIVLLPMHKAYLTCLDGSAQPKTSASKEDIQPRAVGPGWNHSAKEDALRESRLSEGSADAAHVRAASSLKPR